ncbi:MAG TPA: CoA-binding protein [Amycolatopsis sp.]|uniref:CoA-binding protein n=1 Tax=Amycolatopsis sp. TaxID=37632 RepID=UPI002B47D45B|nr:CoA-binding protein [Amycolatopsis sp.]HKS43968.1 CoA-binding protein [Amycolatopsis sp.]
MTWTPPTARQRLAILSRTRSVTLVGASANPARPSFFVATYLLSSSRYRVNFVNPRLNELLGQPVYASVADVPGGVDLVSVFRKHDDLPEVAEEVVKAGASTLWLQLGLWHEAAAERGAEAGLDVVMNRCVKIEHARFAGGLHLAGFNTGVISSRRRIEP